LCSLKNKRNLLKGIPPQSNEKSSEKRHSYWVVSGENTRKHKWMLYLCLSFIGLVKRKRRVRFCGWSISSRSISRILDNCAFLSGVKLLRRISLSILHELKSTRETPEIRRHFCQHKKRFKKRKKKKRVWQKQTGICINASQRTAQKDSKPYVLMEYRNCWAPLRKCIEKKVEAGWSILQNHSDKWAYTLASTMAGSIKRTTIHNRKRVEYSMRSTQSISWMPFCEYWPHKAHTRTIHS
jgi:hypothetical protein